MKNFIKTMGYGLWAVLMSAAIVFMFLFGISLYGLFITETGFRAVGTLIMMIILIASSFGFMFGLGTRIRREEK